VLQKVRGTRPPLSPAMVTPMCLCQKQIAMLDVRPSKRDTRSGLLLVLMALHYEGQPSSRINKAAYAFPYKLQLCKISHYICNMYKFFSDG